MSDEQIIRGYQHIVDLVTELGDDGSIIRDATSAIDNLIDAMMTLDFPDVDTDHFRDARKSVYTGMLAMNEWINGTQGSSPDELEEWWGLNEGDLDY